MYNIWVLFPYHLRNLQIYVIPEKKNKMERRLIKVTIVPKNVNSSLKGKMLSTSYMNRVKLHAGGLKISSMYSPAFTTKYTL